MKRVLALHGYSQNATVFSKRLGALRKECKDIEFVFINAPHILRPAEVTSSDSPTFDSVDQSEVLSLSDMQADPNLALRAWWKPIGERTKRMSIGLEESILYIKDVLRDQRFDGVFGFSQGAAFAAVISALLERPHLHPTFLVDGEAPHPPLQFCVAVSGFRPGDPICDSIFSPDYSTPTLHVIGKTDVIVVEERTQRLIKISRVGRVEMHDGGHFVPLKGYWRKFFANYMRDPSVPHASPTVQVVGSGPSLGTSTPVAARLDYKAALMKL